MLDRPDSDGVSSVDEATELVVRFRLRMVTVDGTVLPERGDILGGVVTGAGSLERAFWTRASRRCI